jgi:hypothetical protein
VNASTRDVHIDGLSEVDDDVCYRAMDALVEVEATVTREIYHSVAHLRDR